MGPLALRRRWVRFALFILVLVWAWGIWCALSWRWSLAEMQAPLAAIRDDGSIGIVSIEALPGERAPVPIHGHETTEVLLDLMYNTRKLHGATHIWWCPLLRSRLSMRPCGRVLFSDGTDWPIFLMQPYGMLERACRDVIAQTNSNS